MGIIINFLILVIAAAGFDTLFNKRDFKSGLTDPANILFAAIFVTVNLIFHFGFIISTIIAVVIYSLIVGNR